jgi:trehalose synthase
VPLAEVPIAPLPPDRFREILTPEQTALLDDTIARGRGLLEGRVAWSVNSTAHGGGVAELLRSLIAYTRGAGVDARWMVIGAPPEFFALTKRIHNHLHGNPGDGGPLGDSERPLYESALEKNAQELAALVRPGDCVLLHDPQTAGLVAPLRRTGAAVVWRCHVGLDDPNDLARNAWRFLLPYVEPADAYVFSREAFAWEDLDRDRIAIIPPSIDAFSPKNQSMDAATCAAVLSVTGLRAEPAHGQPTFSRVDGSPGRVDRRAELVEDSPLAAGARTVVQVSRWDRLKDPAGVLEAFDRHVAPQTDAHLVLAGPSVAAVADDPEGAEVLAEMTERRAGLPADARGRVHLASLPMDDDEENAAIVNALQRRADVLAQKSLAEGFGLTVAEGMWKARPVVASRVGGIRDQIVEGETGSLVDPLDLEGFGAAVVALLEDPAAAERVGRGAYERVRADFLGPRHLGQWVGLFARLLR